MNGPDPNQMYIDRRLCLGEKTKKISRYAVSIFDDICGVAELIHEHWMMETQCTVASPEVFDVGNDLIIIGLGTTSNFHTTYFPNIRVNVGELLFKVQ